MSEQQLVQNNNITEYVKPDIIDGKIDELELSNENYK